MKKLLKHALALTLLIVLLISALAMSSCKKDPDTTIVIRCEETDGDTTLMDYMSELRDNGEITFSVSNGMITSINGIDNPADYSSCWMLYTSDSEMANSAWGTVLYNDVEYGSAILGAGDLKIKEGCLYIWVFKEMSW